MLNFDRLALLREVVVHGGISAAAEVLHMSPSNVSQQVHRLERDYRVKLLEAQGRRVRPTIAAERLVAHTENMLAILDEAEVELTAGRDAQVRTIRLLGFHTFAAELLADVVQRLRISAPGLYLEFAEHEPEDAIKEVIARRADMAVIDEYSGFPLPPAPGIVRVPLGNEPIYPCLPAGSMSAATADWAMEPANTDAARWTRGLCHTVGFDPRVRYVSPDPFVHRSLVEQGAAAAFLPATVFAGVVNTVHIAEDFPQGLHRTHLLVLRRGTEHSASSTACHSAIKAALQAAIVHNPPDHEIV